MGVRLAQGVERIAGQGVWSRDITYIVNDEGGLYLVAVVDRFSRQVVGWRMQPHMQTRCSPAPGPMWGAPDRLNLRRLPQRECFHDA